MGWWHSQMEQIEQKFVDDVEFVDDEVLEEDVDPETGLLIVYAN